MGFTTLMAGVGQRPTVKRKDIMDLRQLLRNFVIHGRGHAINELHMYCPLMYWQVIRETVADQQVYRRISMSPKQSKQGWLKKYKRDLSGKTFSRDFA